MVKGQLSLVMEVTVVTAMFIEQPKDLLKVTMARDLLNQDTDTAVTATMKEALKEFKDMVMEVMEATTRDLLSLDTIIMVMGIPTFTKIVITITDPMDMRLNMITKRDLLNQVILMATALEPVTITEAHRVRAMAMEVTTKDLQSLVIIMEVTATSM